MQVCTLLQTDNHACTPQLITITIIINTITYCTPAMQPKNIYKGNVISARWQVTLCDHRCHVSSHSGVITLQTAIYLLLTYTRGQWGLMEQSSLRTGCPSCLPSVTVKSNEGNKNALTLTCGLTLSFLQPLMDSWWKGHYCLYTRSLTSVPAKIN